MIRIAALVTALLLARPALAEELYCTSDQECPGSATCVGGSCQIGGPNASSSASTAGAAASSPVSADILSVKLNMLAPVTHAVLSIAGLFGPSVSVFAVPIEAERTLVPHASLVSTLTLLTFSSGNGGGVGAIVAAGFRVYPGGTAPNGFYGGAQLSVGQATASLPTTMGLPLGVVLDADAQVQLGYQWVLNSGLTVGVGASWSPLTRLRSGGADLGVGFQVPVGFSTKLPSLPPASPTHENRDRVVKVHPLVPLALLYLSHEASGFYGQPVSVLGLPVEGELALAPGTSVFGTVTPLFASFGTSRGVGGILGAGFRVYPGGAAPSGLYVGAQLILGGATIAIPAGAVSPVSLGFDAQVQLGHQWILGPGVTIGLGGNWSPIIAVTSGSALNGLGFHVPVGFAFE